MPEEDYKKTIVDRIAGSIPLLLILLGSMFVLLGIAGGITYGGWFPIQDASSRLFSGALGVIIIVVGVLRSLKQTTPLGKVDDYGVKIRHPRQGDKVDVVTVDGSIERELPPGYCLRVYRIYHDDTFVPLAKARIDYKEKTWVAEQCSIGGQQNDNKRSFAVCICGVNAEALTSFHNEAVKVHRETMEEFEKATGKKAKFLPAITARPDDMLECHRIRVIRS